MTDLWNAAVERAGARSAEIERLRRLPDDVVSDLVETGVFRTWVAQAYGGEQADLAEGWRRIEEAAYHDGSTGWCVMIAITTSLLSGALPPIFAREINGSPRSITGGFAVPMGRGHGSSDGLVVSGRWSWGSGTSHCTTIGGGVRVESGPLAGATPFVFFNADDVHLHDTWHVAGLKGSGSGDYSVSDVTVPDGRWVILGQEPIIDAPLYRFSTFGALALGVSAVMLGLARRSVDVLSELGERQPQGSSRSMGERAVAQAEVARAEAKVRSARAFIDEEVGLAWLDAENDARVSDRHRRLIRLATTHAAEVATEAVTGCFRTAGGSAIYDDNLLQRLLRDVQVAAQHAMVSPRVFEPLGRISFGLPTDMGSL